VPRRIALSALLALAALVAGVAPAEATFPGHDGDIVFAFQSKLLAIHGTHLAVVAGARGYDLTHPAISPNGRRIAYEISGPVTTSEIFIADYRPGRSAIHSFWLTKNLSRSNKFLSFGDPAWSKDGQHVIFRCSMFSRHDFCSLRTNRRGFRWITHCNCAQVGAHPQISVHNVLAFDAGTDIETVPAGGGRVKKITHMPGPCQCESGYDHPTWAPNGNLLAFTVGDSNSAIDVVDPNGGNRRELIRSQSFGDDPTDYDYPAWSPSGTRIAMHISGLGPSQGGRPESIAVMDTNGQNVQPLLTEEIGQYPYLEWAPAPH
jgi:Tol biopolymer transport system component